MELTQIKTFSHEELLDLLRDCASNLAMAYQEIPVKSLHLISMQAYIACDYLAQVIRQSCPNKTIH